MTLFVGKGVRRPVLRYHGGKWVFAQKIIQEFPEHRIYTEGYGGGASVLIQKPESYSEVYNDKWDVVVNVFRVLRDPVTNARLKELLELTPFSRTEFETGTDLAGIEDPVERARRTIFRSFAGFGSAATNGQHSTGFRANANKSGTTPAHDWANYPSHLPSFLWRLRKVIIENRDAIEVLEHQDTPDTLHYVDPPYPHSTRNMRRGNAYYAHEMSDDDHRRLAKVLKSLRGFVVLSGYACDLYAELYSDWKCIRFKSLADGARARIECLWFNDRAWNNRTMGLLNG